METCDEGQKEDVKIGECDTLSVAGTESSSKTQMKEELLTEMEQIVFLMKASMTDGEQQGLGADVSRVALGKTLYIKYN